MINTIMDAARPSKITKQSTCKYYETFFLEESVKCLSYSHFITEFIKIKKGIEDTERKKEKNLKITEACSILYI